MKGAGREKKIIPGGYFPESDVDFPHLIYGRRGKEQTGIHTCRAAFLLQSGCTNPLLRPGDIKVQFINQCRPPGNIGNDLRSKDMGVGVNNHIIFSSYSELADFPQHMQ